jgi:hypothetical protein
MSLFGKYFGSENDNSKGSGSGNLSQNLRDLERRAEAALLGTGWTHLNRAGDMCLKAGDKVKAVKYFGQAIDSLLEDELPEPARGVAKKIIRVHPGAVRTLCTLTWLDLAARQPASAVLSLRCYADAAKRGSREDLAAEQVFTMARLTASEAFLTEAGEVLADLGFTTYSLQVKDWLAEGGSEDCGGEPEDLARVCLSAAVGSNALRKAEGALA